MSDVSGIPYMGSMGTGGFFAPQFAYNPQLSAGQIQSNYMPGDQQQPKRIQQSLQYSRRHGAASARRGLTMRASAPIIWRKCRQVGRTRMLMALLFHNL
jgi:hypothetical protein